MIEPIPGRLIILSAALILSALAAVLPAGADSSLRCNGSIVSLGASRQQVLDACGAPDAREIRETARDQYVRQFYDYKRQRWILPKLIVGPVQTERWTYDFGPNRFIRYLHFLDGQLTKIETGDKGAK